MAPPWRGHTPPGVFRPGKAPIAPKLTALSDSAIHGATARIEANPCESECTVYWAQKIIRFRRTSDHMRLQGDELSAGG